MAIPEQAGKVATSAIDALKGSPGLLVLVLLQIGTLAMIYFSVQKTLDRAHEREMTILQRCLSVDHTKE